MFEDDDVAKQINELMLEFRVRLSDSVVYVRETCGEKEALQYNKAVGKVLGYMIYEIIEPVYDRHPVLRPEDLKGEKSGEE